MILETIEKENDIKKVAPENAKKLRVIVEQVIDERDR